MKYKLAILQVCISLFAILAKVIVFNLKNMTISENVLTSCGFRFNEITQDNQNRTINRF